MLSQSGPDKAYKKHKVAGKRCATFSKYHHAQLAEIQKSCFIKKLDARKHKLEAQHTFQAHQNIHNIKKLYNLNKVNQLQETSYVALRIL